MRKPVLYGLAAAAFALGVATVAAPATADTCPSGATCGYGTTNWGGKAYPVYGNNTSLPYYGFSHAESIYNNGTSCNVYLYPQTNYKGGGILLNKGTGWKTISGSSLWHHTESNYWC